MEVVTCEVRLRTVTSGRLQSWLGPALRGITARRLKDSACSHPLDDREARWAHCAGCPVMQTCAYGQTFEPDPPQDAPTFRGQEDAARPVVLAPSFPVPEDGECGLDVPVIVTCLGESAARHLRRVIEALAGGREPGSGRGRQEGRIAPEAGLGPDHVAYELISSAKDGVYASRLVGGDLPATLDAVPGHVPRLGVVLTAPLFLRYKSQSGVRSAILRPTFADLLRASLRTLGALFALYEAPLDVDFAALKAAAQRVQILDNCFAEFQQVRSSSRSGQRFDARGVVGGAVYTDVPFALVPWLLWGGRLHVGTHRVAGAGSWRLVMY